MEKKREGWRMRRRTRRGRGRRRRSNELQSMKQNIQEETMYFLHMQVHRRRKLCSM